MGEEEKEEEELRRARAFSLGLEDGFPDGWPDLEEVDAPPPEYSPDTAPFPTSATDVDLTQGEFWDNPFVQVGSVIEFSNPRLPEAGPLGISAALVEACTPFSNGLKLVVKYLGASTKEEKAATERTAKTHGVHLCYLVGGVCGIAKQPGIHLLKFTWHPPGDFTAKWLSKKAQELVEKGKTLATEASMGFPANPGSAGGDPSTPASVVEGRLDAVKRKAALRTGRVSFNPSVQSLSPVVPGGSGLTPLQAGPSSTRASSSLQAAPRMRRMKVEPIAIESSGDEKIQPKPQKKKTLGASLTLAVQQQQDKATKEEEKRKKDRSRSRSKKKKKKRSSSDDKNSKDEESDSSDSMMPPLKKKAKKHPGSVYKLLESQAVEALAQDGVIEEGFAVDAKGNNRIKLHTYFQLALRPHLDLQRAGPFGPRSRLAKRRQVGGGGRLAVGQTDSSRYGHPPPPSGARTWGPSQPMSFCQPRNTTAKSRRPAEKGLGRPTRAGRGTTGIPQRAEKETMARAKTRKEKEKAKTIGRVQPQKKTTTRTRGKRIECCPEFIWGSHGFCHFGIILRAGWNKPGSRRYRVGCRVEHCRWWQQLLLWRRHQQFSIFCGGLDFESPTCWPKGSCSAGQPPGVAPDGF